MKFVLIFCAYLVVAFNATAIDLRGIALGTGQQIEIQQQQQNTNMRQQCFANCNNNGNCMQGCAAPILKMDSKLALI